jgi:NTE family protein
LISQARAVIASALLACCPLLAQQPGEPTSKPVVTPQTRPRIGLVLEGGGALGFAHIGVIQWLEDHHIPVDFVAGNSMGGLVGGLYAAGNRAPALQKIVSNIDWPVVLSGQVPFQALSFRRKEDRLAYPNRLEFGLKHGFSAPSGLNPGGGVQLIFSSNLLAYYDLKSFDDLPIPFRCVATELISGKEKIFSSGSLPQALRSTMSIPAVFAPVTHEKQVYADGLAVNNLPVDVARDMGADIVIAVYLDTGAFDPNTLKSLLGVVGRTEAILVSENELQSLKNANILISVDVSKYTATEFRKSEEIIPLGVDAAKKKAGDLEKYALSDVEWKAYLERRGARVRTEIPVPQFVDAETRNESQRRELVDDFRQFAGKPVDLKLLSHKIADAEGTGHFSAVDFSLVDRDGKTGLILRPLDKDYGPPFVNLGLQLDGNDANNIRFGVGGRVTAFDVVGPGSEWRTDLNLGLLAGVQTELYRPFRKAPTYFTAGRGYYTHALQNLYSNGQQLAQYKTSRNGFGFDVGHTFGQRTQIRITQDLQWFKQTRTIGQELSQEFDLRPWVTGAHFRYYTQDNAALPFSGTVVELDFNRYSQGPVGAPQGYQQLEGSVGHFQPVSTGGSVFVRLQGGTSFDANDLGLAGLSIGGAFHLSAYDRNELLNSRYFLLQSGYQQRLFKLNPFLGDAIYGLGFVEVAKASTLTDSTTLPMDVAGALVTRTLLGPLFIGGSIGDSGHRKWFFGINRIF